MICSNNGHAICTGVCTPFMIADCGMRVCTWGISLSSIVIDRPTNGHLPLNEKKREKMKKKGNRPLCTRNEVSTPLLNIPGETSIISD